jgi:hypothetical protein
MNDLVPPGAMIVLLTKAERQLLLRHGLRLSVDRITADGRYALCTAMQVERKFLRTALKPHEIVDRCHQALISLHTIGSEPLIQVLPITAALDHPTIEEEDPFQLCTALRASNLEARIAPDLLMPPRSRQNGLVIGQR